MQKNWDQFDDWTKNYLISQKDTMNNYAKNFLERMSPKK